MVLEEISGRTKDAQRTLYQRHQKLESDPDSVQIARHMSEKKDAASSYSMVILRALVNETC